jgi:CheY-like chemotaxis protein
MNRQAGLDCAPDAPIFTRPLDAMKKLLLQSRRNPIRDSVMDPQNVRETNRAIRRGLRARSSGGNPMLRILVADVDHQTRKTMVRTLTRENYEVLDVADGRQAIAAVEQSSFDLVITGITMPKASGLVVISTLRRRFPRLKFIAVAQENEPRCNANAARAFGAALVLTQPLDPEELLAVVEETLSETR